MTNPMKTKSKESIDVDIKYFEIPRMVRDILPPNRVPGQGKVKIVKIGRVKRFSWFYKWWYGTDTCISITQ